MFTLEKSTKYNCVIMYSTGGEDDDCGGMYFCHLLAALPRLLPAAAVLPRNVRGNVHPAGLPCYHVVGHELYHVQPHHLLLLK